MQPEQGTWHRRHTMRPSSRPARLRAATVVVISLALIASTFARPSFAQQRGNTAWTSFNRELLGSNVLSVLVDDSGAVWFGTEAGVNRFDGSWHTLGEQEGLPGGAVNALAQTSDGRVWVGSDGGLAVIDFDPARDAQIVTTVEDVAERVRALHETLEGELWVGTDVGARYLNQDGWHTVVSPETGGQLGPVSAIASGPADALWLGGSLLYRHSSATGPVERINFEGAAPIRTILVEAAIGGQPGMVWVGTDGDGLWGYNGQEWAHFLRPAADEPLEALASNAVLTLAQESDGTLWIGTNGEGISLFNRNGLSAFWGGGYWRTLTTIDGLSANAVGAIAIDAEDVAWIGTLYGANRFDGRSWRTLTSPDLPAGVDVVTALVDSTGVLWLGTEGSGLIRFDGKALERLTSESHGLPQDFVRTLAEDPQRNLWVGTATQGVAAAPLVGRADLTTLHDADWLKFSPVQLGSEVQRASLVSRDGSLWFGTYDAGVSRLIPGSNGASDPAARWEQFTTAQGLPSNEINQDAMLEDSQGRIWIGTPAGLGRFEPASGTWRSFTAADGLNDPFVLSIAQIPEGAAIYAGTQNGTLYRFDPETERWASVLNLATPINNIETVPGQGLWLGTSSGLTRYDPAKGLYRTYTREDGLVDNDVVALAAGQSGEVWAGTKLGITRHLPDRQPPNAEILAVNGRKPNAETVQILAGQPLVISFRGTDLLTPEGDLGYRVRLDGVDPDWQAVDDRQVTYRNLGAGDYTFEVEAWDAALNTSAAPAQVRIEVLPSATVPLLGRVSFGSALSILGLLLLTVSTTAGLLFLHLRNRRRRREALLRRFNPYVSGDPIQDQEMFFNRENVLAKIINTLHENSIMIYGERRIGKTSLLYQLARQLREVDDPDYLFIPVYVDLEGTPQEEMFHLLMEEILRVLPAYLPDLPPTRFAASDRLEYNDRSFGHDLSELLERLGETTSRQVRLILLLDEIDVINRYDSVTQQQLRRIFMRTFARNLGAVVAGIQISKEWDRVESPWYNLFNEIELGPLNDDAARRLILEPVKGVYGFDPEAVELILDVSQGRPFYIQQHCLEAVNNMLAAGRTRVTLEDVEKALDTITSARTSQNSGLTTEQAGQKADRSA